MMAAFPALKVCFLILVTLGFVSSAPAQYVGSLLDPNMPLLGDAAQVREFMDSLALTPDQEEAFLRIHDEFEAIRADVLARHAALMQRNRELQEDRVEAPNESAAIDEKLRSIMSETAALSESLYEQREATLASLGGLMTEEQTVVWNSIMMEVRRELTLPIGTQFSGESVDLIACLNALEIDWTPVRIQLLKYQLTLDDLLRQRNTMIMAEGREHIQRMINRDYERYGLESNIALAEDLRRYEEKYGEMRGEELTDWVNRRARPALEQRIDQRRPRYEMSRRMRDLNLATLEQVCSALSAEDALRLRERFNEQAYRSYGGLYQPLTVDRYVEDILNDPGISIDVAEAIRTQYATTFEPSRSTFDDQIASACREFEDAWEARMLREDDGSTLRRIMELLQQRDDLQRWFVETLAASLPEVVRSRHPVPEIDDASRFPRLP